MAIRGKVKVIKDMGSNYTGKVKDTAAGIEYDFEQPLGAQLGLAVDVIVKMEVITKPDGTKLAVCLDPVDKAKIETIDYETNSGTLKDNRGYIINFEQNYMRELGLSVGDRVSYFLVQPTASSDGGTGVGGGAGSTDGGAVGGSAGGVNTIVGTAVCLQKVS